MKVSEIERKVVENFSGALAVAIIGPVSGSLVSSMYSLYNKAKQEFKESYETLHLIFSDRLY